MKTKLNGILALILVLLVQIAFAQEKTVSGTVTDDSGPLPGVNVIIKGTNTGTQTDFDGKYSIKASTGDLILFSYVGMNPQEVLVGASNTVNVIMTGSNLLEEIVVVGYGTTTKQSFTGTATVVKADKLALKSVSNVSQALAGEVSGVNVINTSGQPGTEATIRIRGFGSVNGNRDPLYVLDGVPFSGSINSINPSDIASTTVLKDATATAIYGSRGANGVILITTKTGKVGTSEIEVNVKTGVNFSSIPRYDVIKSPEEFIELAWHAMSNRGLSFNPTSDGAAYANTYLFSSRGINAKYNMWDVANASELIDPATGKVKSGVQRKYDPENWEDYGFQSSIRTEADLKMSGGSENTRYFSSFGYLDDIGYIINSDYKRYSTRLNISHKPKEWLTANANIGYVYSQTNNNGQSEDSGSVFWFVDNIPSIYPLFSRDTNGELIPDEIYGGNVYDYGVGRGFGALTNSIADSKYDKTGNDRHELNGNFSINFDITEGLTFENQYGVQYYNRTYNSINNPFYGSGASNGGSIYKTLSNALTQNLLSLIRYKKSFDSSDLEVLLAHETNQYTYNITTASKERVVNLEHGLDVLNNYVVTSSPSSGYQLNTSIESYFGQVNYNLQDKYFLTGSVRRDGSSRFAKDKWGTFGSVGLSWIMNKESFMDNVDFINYLKLKSSYGLLGDQAGVGRYSGQNTYTINNLNDEISLGVNAIENPNLTWETSKIFQTGLEFTLFNNIVDGSVDFYNKITDDLIFDRRMGPSLGDALITVNDGKLKNQGIEFDLTTHILKSDNFKLDFTVNGEMLTNELVNMPIDPATGEEKLIDISGAYGRSVGHSLYDFYMREWAGVDPDNGLPLWNVSYFDANNNSAMDAGEEILSLHEYQIENPTNSISETTTSVYQNATQKYVGKSAIPKIRGAFRLSGQFHSFDFSSQFAYSLGGYAYDGAYASLMHNRQIGNNNWHTDIRNSWKAPGDVTDVPRLISNLETNVNSLSSRFITSSDYLTLSNVKVGYTLPNRYIENSGLTDINIWVSGDNLFLLSSRDGFNPATSETGATSTYRYSPLTTLTLGVRVKF